MKKIVHSLIVKKKSVHQSINKRMLNIFFHYYLMLYDKLQPTHNSFLGCGSALEKVRNHVETKHRDQVL